MADWGKGSAFGGKQSACRACVNERNRTVYSRTEQYKHLKREAQRRRRALAGPPTPEENRRNNLWKLYKMTLEDYEFQLAVQGGRCAICRTAEPGHKGVFVVDHCHAGGHVRSLLCQGCNIGLGAFRDDPARLLAAAKYLEEHAA